MIKMSNLLRSIQKGLTGVPAGSEAFYGAIVSNRVEGVPTLAEARRDYDRMLVSRRGHPFS